MKKPKEIDIVAELRMHIFLKYKTQTKAAKAWGVSSAMVSLVLSGINCPTPIMLKDAGFQRIYTPVKYRRL